MSLHHKLFRGFHNQDILVANLEARVPKTSRGEIISLLKETCREMEDTIITDTTRKDKLEELIKSLTEESKKEVKAADGEGNNASDVTDKNTYDGDASIIDEESEGYGYKEDGDTDVAGA